MKKLIASITAAASCLVSSPVLAEGAIYVGTDYNGHSQLTYRYNYSSYAEASSLARRDCKNRGYSNCRLLLEVPSGVYFSVSMDGYGAVGAAYNYEYEEAIYNAIDKCEQYSSYSGECYVWDTLWSN